MHLPLFLWDNVGVLECKLEDFTQYNYSKHNNADLIIDELIFKIKKGQVMNSKLNFHNSINILTFHFEGTFYIHDFV